MVLMKEAHLCLTIDPASTATIQRWQWKATSGFGLACMDRYGWYDKVWRCLKWFQGVGKGPQREVPGKEYLNSLSPSFAPFFSWRMELSGLKAQSSQPICLQEKSRFQVNQIVSQPPHKGLAVKKIPPALEYHFFQKYVVLEVLQSPIYKRYISHVIWHATNICSFQPASFIKISDSLNTTLYQCLSPLFHLYLMKINSQKIEVVLSSQMWDPLQKIDPSCASPLRCSSCSPVPASNTTTSFSGAQRDFGPKRFQPNLSWHQEKRPALLDWQRGKEAALPYRKEFDGQVGSAIRIKHFDNIHSYTIYELLNSLDKLRKQGLKPPNTQKLWNVHTIFHFKATNVLPLHPSWLLSDQAAETQKPRTSKGTLHGWTKV